jgi:HK97 family phage prohead protease
MLITAQIKSASEKGGAVTIEGYANKFEVDSYKERMDPSTIIMERYKQNPILLFNHDTNYPIGKVLAVESRKDGVYCKASISKGNDPKLNFIRELVLDGTLKTFSVRFDIQNEKSIIDDPEHQGVKLIKNWELQEISIVSIPAQPASTFSLVGAKSLGEARQMILKAKGADAAAYINECIDMAVKDGAERAGLMNQLVTISGMNEGQVASILAGDVTPIPGAFQSAAVEVLKCDEQKLGELNAGDVQSEGDKPVEKPSEEMTQQDGSKSKQAGQDPGLTAPIDTGMETTTNPMLERLDAVVSQLGAMNDKMVQLISLMQQDASSEEVEPVEKEDPKPELEPEMKPAESDQIEKALQDSMARITEKLKGLGISM